MPYIPRWAADGSRFSTQDSLLPLFPFNWSGRDRLEGCIYSSLSYFMAPALVSHYSHPIRPALRKWSANAQRWGAPRTFLIRDRNHELPTAACWCVDDVSAAAAGLGLWPCGPDPGSGGGSGPAVRQPGGLQPEWQRAGDGGQWKCSQHAQTQT